jgi:hypothetical protein
MVEFALVAPLFFLLLFGIIEAGRFVFYHEILANATREGARYAIVNGANVDPIGCPSGPPAPGSVACDVPGDNVVAATRNAAIGLGGSVSVTPSWRKSDGTPGGNNGRGQTVNVAATFTYHTLIPVVPFPDIVVEAESSLVINN